ncbi:hypothetical protein FQN57_006292 [Myotisia sp. PD_48]|nr:hypothetical protein FQN57_006292 [Myotisia sp. PD_48]
MAPAFDPFEQSLVFHRGDGGTFNVSLSDLNKFMVYNVRVSISGGAQLGASVLMVLLLALLTAPEKRLSIVFVLNCATLVVNVVRTACSGIFFTTSWSDIYAYHSGDFSRVTPAAYANSIIGTVTIAVMLILIEFSLLVQTQVVCSTLRDLYRNILLAVSGIVALVAVGFRFGMMVENCKAIIGQYSIIHLKWLQSASNIATTASICYFSAIFMAKLGYAIYSRKKLGIKRFGAMQIIFIMACQTMVFPAIFSVLEYFVPQFEINANVFTLLALSLPLTTLWSAAAIKHGHEADMSSRKRFWAGPRNDSQTTRQGSGAATVYSQPSSTMTGTTFGHEKDPLAQFDRLYPDAGNEKHITVDRNFSLSSDRM